MNKWLAVAALSTMMAAVGCQNNDKDASADPKKMSSSDGAACSVKKDAAPKKLSASDGAACAAKGDCSKAKAK
jgi:hypothetical protein